MLVEAVCFTSKWKRRWLERVDIWETSQCYCVHAEWACFRAVIKAFSLEVRGSNIQRMAYREGLQLVPVDAHMRTVTYCHQ